MQKAVLIAASVLAASSAIAEAVKGEAELGLVQTTGNSETSNISAKLKLTKETEKWKHEARLSALGSSSEDSQGNDETTAEKYRLDLKSDLKLDERSFFYTVATYEDDRFSGFEYQATLGAGYGYHVIKEETTQLTLEIGPGYRYNSIEMAPDEDEATLRLAEKFDWKFSETAELNQYIVAEGGDDNTITTAGVAVKSSLTGTLALKVGIDIKYTEEVPAGNEHMDTETYANVTYSF